MNIKFGLKLWSTNQDALPQVEELIEENVFQYIELTPIPNTRLDPFLEAKAHYVIHITTERYGVNIADEKKKKFNLKTIDNCIEWADMLDAEYLILHPGFGSMDKAMEFMGDINDKRILIENMPRVGVNNEKMIGYTPEQIKELMGERFGLCLDFGHAIKAAVSLNEDYKKYIKKFLKINPKMFHISDGKLNSEKDEHLHIGEGEYDFEFLMDCVRKSESKYVTLETPRTNLNSLKEDLRNLEKLKSLTSL